MIMNSVRIALRTAAVASVGIFGAANAASADVILGAVAGAINSGGPGFGTLTETFDQSGLSAGYVSGVTDFDAYLAGNPTHTVTFDGFEWFSNSGADSASVTYDLGAVHTIGRVALWNEESAGIGSLDLYGSTDGVTFAALSLGLLPTDNPLNATSDGPDYSADVFGFGPTAVRYIRFDMSDCPQPVAGEDGPFPACAIGEVAFAETDVQVPEPASALLLGLGLAGAAAVRRRRARK